MINPTKSSILVNQELTKVYHWLASNRLTLNVKKSKFMLITRKRIDPTNFSVKINGTELEQCDTYKYLGVYFDKDLNWKAHIDYISKKISKSCGSLAKIRHCLEIDTLREVYHALIHSYLRYGIIAWGSASQTALKKLQTIVNRALRIMTFAPFGNVEIDPLYEILELLKVNETYTLEVAKFAYKQQNNLLPIRLANYFDTTSPENSARRSSRLRSTSQTHVVTNTVLGNKSIQKKIIQIWKDVPEEIRITPYFNAFKRMFKSHLILLYV